MKKAKFFIAAAGAMLLTACSQDELVMQSSSDGSIGYSVLTRNPSRAADSYCQNNLPTEFKVWAKTVETNQLYINGDQIVKSGDSYKNVTASRFWPAESLTFYAYVNGDDNFDYNDGVSPKFVDFTVEENVAEQVDLMYAVTKDATGDETNPDVTLNFRHALSQVCFKAQNKTPNLRITIHNVGVGGLIGKGTYTFPDKTTSDLYEDHTDNLYESEFDPINAEQRGSWNLSEDAADAKKYYEVALNDAVTLNPTQTEASNLTCIANTNEHNEEIWKDVMTLMPQTQNPCTSNKAENFDGNTDVFPNDGAYFKLYITVDNVVMNDDDEIIGEVTLLKNKPFYVPVNVEWAQGYRYIYTLVFSEDWAPDNLVEIGYTVTADDFVNTDGGETQDPEWWGEEGPKKVLMVEATEDQPAIYVADRNLGATTAFDISDEAVNFGKYYAWGNLTGTTKTLKEDFEAMGWTKFSNNNWDQFMAYDIFDESGNLKPEYDAATNALGEDWHIPTKEEWERFLEGTTRKFSDYTTGSGRYVIFTSKTTGNTVSIPCPGYLGSGGYITRIGESGEYMSSTPKMPDVGTVNSAYGLQISTPNSSVTIGTVSVWAQPASIRPFSNTAQ